MKVILIVVLLTLGFVASMSFIEAKRTENLNRINLEYQQSLINISKENIVDNTKEEDKNIEEEVSNTIKVTITGAVEKEGEYELEKDSYLQSLLSLAILKDDADSTAYNLYYSLEDKDTIYIPYNNGGNKISINTANEETLDLLPGVGITLAKRIVDYRLANGNFECIDHLKKVEGIGDSVFNKLKDYVKL